MWLAQRDPETFFGDDPKAKVKELKILTHPDKWPGDQQADVIELFNGFVNAEKQLVKDPVDMAGYKTTRLLADGDLCRVWVAVKDGKRFLIKEPTVKAPKELRRELEFSQKFYENGKVIATLLPKFTEMIKHGQLDCSVQEYVPEFETLATYRSRFPDGIPGQHIGWIFRRVCYALDYAFARGVCNGAITPDHVCLNGQERSLKLLGWIHGGAPSEKLRFIPGKWKKLYPAHFAKEKTHSPGLDVAMLSATLLEVASPDLPQKLKRYLTTRLNGVSVRSGDSWKAQEQIKDILRDVYGQPKFIPLLQGA